MKSKLKITDLNFTYTGNNFTEKEIILKGYNQLTAKQLYLKINNKTIFGDYPGGYIFSTNIFDDGRVEGINNVGSYDFGNWLINYEKHTLQLKWKNGWANTISRAYDVNGNIEFYDVNTGFWITTFKVLKHF